MLKGPGCLPSSMMEDEVSGLWQPQRARHMNSACFSSTSMRPEDEIHLSVMRQWFAELHCGCREAAEGWNLHVNAQGNDPAATARQRGPSLPPGVFPLLATHIAQNKMHLHFRFKFYLMWSSRRLENTDGTSLCSAPDTLVLLDVKSHITACKKSKWCCTHCNNRSIFLWYSTLASAASHQDKFFRTKMSMAQIFRCRSKGQSSEYSRWDLIVQKSRWSTTETSLTMSGSH